jgi:PTH1 family peptidyl-tRNA hydrolase
VQVLDYFKLPYTSVLVVVDETALDLGQLRLRKTGTAGGHNGLKSIEAHLKTRDYARLRVGVGAGTCTCPVESAANQGWLSLIWR